jgi:hypothetical protein
MTITPIEDGEAGLDVRNKLNQVISNVQSGSTIKSLYEAEANAFTDSDHTKIDGIEALADVTDTDNVTAAGALMDSELASIANVKALNQSVISGAAPVFAATNMTVDDTEFDVVDTTNLQTFAEGVDHALLKARGTGVTSSYVSTIGTTTFAQPEVFGEISSDEGYFDVHYTGATGITVTTLSANSTYVYIDNAGVLRQQVTVPTRQDWSRKIFLMRIAVNTVTEEILGFEYLNNPIGHYANSIRDVYTYLLAQGIPFKKNQVVTGRGAADLGFDVSSGTLLEFGGTGDINNANIKSFDAVANASYDLLDRTTIAASGQTDLVKFWDNAGSILGLGSTTFVGHRLYRFSNGAFAMQYGQGNYANMDLAKAGVLLEDYVLNPRLENATFFGWWFIDSTATTTGGTVKTDFVEYTIGIQGGTSGGLAGCLLKGNNLSDLLDASAARTNLGLTAADIKVLYEGETSAFTDALFTKLGNIETSATADQTGAEIKAAYESETNAFTDTQFTKLSNIEASATADQTGAQIKAAYEAEANAFTDTQFTKLSNIEASATADQTAAQIKAAYEGEANAFTDTQFTKLGNIETAATADQTGAQIKAAYEGEANAFTDTQFTKLDGIETAATADQTGSQIKSSYEAEADTNAFTDADHTKLDGIETSATADQTSAQIKAAYESETNAFTDALFTKLSNIETAATADQTAAQIKAAYEGEANAFTDTQFTKLGNIETGANVTDAANVDAAGAVMNSDASTTAMSFVIDEDDMSSNSSTKVPTQQSVRAFIASSIASQVVYKGGYNASTNTPDLDTDPSSILLGWMYTVTAAGTFFSTDVEIGDVLIAEQNDPDEEANWTVVNKDLNAASIKTSYESNSDTNAFTDNQVTKLAGIETGATADQTAAQIKAEYEGEANAFTDALFTKLGNIETGATADQTAAQIKAEYEGEANAFTDTLFTKLDGIETAATADQTGAQIKAAYEGEAETNAFTDADHTKLNGIETSATADQTAAEIKSAYEGEASAFTDAQFTKLSNIETAATADQTGAQIKAAYEGQTSAFTDAQFTKLGNIETAATADQTGSQIKTAYEAESDTNAFTDADHTKLDGIATSATGVTVTDWDTAGRPGSPAAGMFGYNTETGDFEGYTDAWGAIAGGGGSGGGGLFKGNNGEVGSAPGDIFRVNAKTLTANTTIDADENAVATGPLTVDTGVTLTITAGGTLVIV